MEFSTKNHQNSSDRESSVLPLFIQEQMNLKELLLEDCPSISPVTVKSLKIRIDHMSVYCIAGNATLADNYFNTNASLSGENCA